MWPVKNHRVFNLSRGQTIQPVERRDRIKFERLLHHKLNPVWWKILILVLTFCIYIYLKAL